jgi:TatD DNase family protein
MIDFHCHLDLYKDPAEVVRECVTRNLYVLSVTTTPSAWLGTHALSSDSRRVKTALGLHPQLALQRKGELPLFDNLIARTRYVGEVGLDGSPECKTYWGEQISVFDHILATCQQRGGRVISIHSRKAARQVLDQLAKYPGCGQTVLHWFSGSVRDLERAVAMGCWFSVGPAMLAGERGRTLVSRMPRDKVVTETDGPFAQLDGRSVYPWDALIALQGLASLWGLSLIETKKFIDGNFRALTGRHATLELIEPEFDRV